MIKVLQKSGGDAFIEDKVSNNRPAMIICSTPLQYGHTPFYYRTHGKRLNIRTLKDNAVINQLISGQLNRPLLQGKCTHHLSRTLLSHSNVNAFPCFPFGRIQGFRNKRPTLGRPFGPKTTKFMSAAAESADWMRARPKKAKNL